MPQESLPSQLQSPAPPRLRFGSLLPLALCAVLLEGCFGAILQLKDLKLHVIPLIGWALAAGIFYLIAVWLAVHQQQERPGEWRLVLAAAVVFRLTVLPLFPSLSDDAYRYRWEGRIQAYGFNPYLYPPNDRVFDPIRGPDFFLVNGKEIASVYPPLAELVFRLNYALSPRVRVEKLLYVLFDLLTIVLLARWLHERGQPRTRALIYAWAPLAVVEYAASGHMDSIPVFFALLALYLAGRRDRLSALAIAAAVLAKFFPLLLLSAWLGRVRRSAIAWGAVFGAVVCSLYAWSNRRLAYGALLANLRAFSARWYHNNDSLFAVFCRVFGGGYQSLEPARQVVLIVVVGTIGWAAAKHLQPTRAAFVIIAAVLLVSPNVFPWYLLWLLPWLCFAPSAAWLYFSVAVFLGYQALIGYEILGSWDYTRAVIAVEYVPLYLLLTIDVLKQYFRSLRHPQPL